MELWEAEQDFIRRFNGLEDWMARYDYLMMEGLAMPKPGKGALTDENRLWDCQSKVWLVAWREDGRIYIRAYSPSLIVGGLMAVLVKLLDGRSYEEILSYEMTFFKACGLASELGGDRERGLLEALKRIKAKAQLPD